MSATGQLTMRETLDRWFAAFNAHDIDAVSALAHPEIELVPLGHATTAPPGTRYHGHEGLRSLSMPGFVPGEMQEYNDSMLVPLTFHLDDGETETLRQGFLVFRFEDGLVRRVNAFDTRTQAEHFIKELGTLVLTPREREILALLAEGLHADEVAQRLVISPLTVRTHIRNAKDKLGARTAGQAIAMAMRDDA
jgi:DNA-binding CsgD family transcriptional regulator